MTLPILVTGAGGFLAAAIIRQLLEAGHPVVGLSRAAGTPTRLRGLSGLDMRTWDPAAPRIAGEFSALIHAAAAYGRGGEPVSDLIKANVAAGLLLAEELKGRCGRMLHVGSALPARVSPYALSKHQFAEWGLAGFLPMPFTQVSCQHFYGPGDDAGKFLTRVARACLLHASVLELTEGTQRRDFIHVDDVASAVVLLIGGPAPVKPAQYQLGSGTAVSVRSVVEAIHALAGSRTELRFGAVALRPEEPAECVADIAALTALGWHPGIGLQQGLEHMVTQERACVY